MARNLLPLLLILFFISCKKEKNHPPVVENQTFEINENHPSGASVGVFVASDEDSDPLQYQFLGVDDDFPFTISMNTGEVKLKNSFSLDYETKSQYSVTVEVDDDPSREGVQQAVLTINVANVVENPALSEQSFSVEENIENGYVIGKIEFESLEKNQSLVISIETGNDDGIFNIDQNGNLSVADRTVFDYERNKKFVIGVKAQDQEDPSLFSSAFITINILDANEIPNVQNQDILISENSDFPKVIGTVQASDNDAGQILRFSIAGEEELPFIIDEFSGQLSIIRTIDYEAKSQYNIEVKVSDDGEEALSAIAEITIRVQDVNEAPVVTEQSFSVPENSHIGISLGRVLAADPDRGQTLTYNIVGENSLPFRIGHSNGEIIVSGKIDYEMKTQYKFTVSIMDNGEGNLASVAEMTVDVEDEEEPNPPVNGLLAYFPFNGNTSDVSGNGNSAIRHGTITFSEDYYGNNSSSIYINENSYLSVPHTDDFDFEDDDFSISVWVKSSNYGEQMIFQKGGLNDTEDPQTWMRLNDRHDERNSDVTFLTGDGVPPSLLTSVVHKPVCDGKWHHLVAVRSGDRLQIYIDGELASLTSGVPKNVNNTQDLKFGLQISKGYFYSSYIGNMDEIRIYARALTANEVDILWKN